MKSTIPSNGFRAAVIFVLAAWGSSPLMAFVNGQNADLVLGRPTFTSPGGFGFPSTCTQDGMTDPTGALYVNDLGQQWLFTTEWKHDRVLVFQSPFSNGEPASYVLGQYNFTSSFWVSTCMDSASLAGPLQLAYDYVHHYLFVAEELNARVMVFDMTNLHSHMDATYQLGQSIMTMELYGFPNPNAYQNDGTGQNNPNVYGMVGATGVAYDASHNRLFVSDAGNNRVMVFDLNVTPLTTPPPIPATYVLGQPTFTQRSIGNGNGALYIPGGLTYDPAHQWLFVADSGNNRIVIYDLSGGLSNGMPAAYVLGQAGWGTSNPGTSQSAMKGPFNTEFDPVQQRLFVSDHNNQRVLIFNLWGGVTNGMNAAGVLGQANFKTATAATSKSGLALPRGMSYDPVTQRLFVADDENDRVLAFDPNDLADTITVPCAASTKYTICGTVTAAEDYPLFTPLVSVPVELLGSQGELLSTTKTKQDGTYSFGPSDGLAENATYFITPAVGRTMSSLPLQTAVTALTSAGAVADLQIRGWPSPLTVTTGVSGAAILISTANYIDENAPALDPNSAAGSGFYSAASGWNGSASVPLPKGSYFVTCWVPQLTGGTVTYSRVPAAGIGSLGPIHIAPNTPPQSAVCN